MWARPATSKHNIALKIACTVWQRRAAAVLSILVMTVHAALPATAATKHAAMVMDANTGKILHSRHGDAPRYPASLTKMMTLYMAFDLIEKGRMSYNSRIRISPNAASRPPSKLGLKAGTSIRAIDAIKALVTKSANDVATALAEHIGGSEANFARLMTQKARALGMTATVFKNASGLPDAQQKSTARDMLTLALALQDNHPKHYRLFKTRTFRYRGKTYRNHNTLLGSVQGVDGIKTGYIRAAGFNLVSSVRTDGKHVVAAVFGGKTARARNKTMRSLLSNGLKRASRRKTRRSKPLLVASPREVQAQRKRIARAPTPPRKITAPARELVRQSHLRQPVQRKTAPIASQPRRPQIEIATVKRVNVLEPRQQDRPAARYAARPTQQDTWSAQPGTFEAPAQPRPPITRAAIPAPAQPSDTHRAPGRPPSTLQAQLANMLSDSGAADRTLPGSYGLNGPDPSPLQLRGTHAVQVGAYASRSEAETRLAQIANRENLLVGKFPRVAIPVSTGKGRLYRARFAGFDSRQATQTCLELRRRAIDCFVARTN